MPDEIEKVHKRIRQLRIEKGFSILKLSVESGISRSHLFYIESKRISPSLETLYKIAMALNVELIDFFKE